MGVGKMPGGERLEGWAEGRDRQEHYELEREGDGE
jgi:hypothetical protein